MPVTPNPPDADNEGTANYLAFIGIRKALEDQCPDRWVLLYESKLVDHYDTYDLARAGARTRNLDPARCLFQKLNANPPVLM